MFPLSSSIDSESWPDWFLKMILGDHSHQSLKTTSACASRIGGRKENQDRCLKDDDAAVYLVVDGMGGYKGGALASQIAVEAIGDRLRAACLEQPTRESMEAALHESLTLAHQEMATVASENPEFRKMGCTLAAAAVVNDRVFYTHIGDSRVYLIHNGKIKRLTKDETLLEEMMDANLLAKSDAVNHRWRHIVTNSLSTRGLDHEPHWEELKLADGDQILLTSDGLTDELSDHDIVHQIRRAETPRQCVKSLIQEALDRNAKDNVTCVVTKIQREE